MKESFKQGDIWLVRLDPTESSEIKKTRPCLVISRSKINLKLNTVTVLPISSGKTDKSILLINIEASQDNGLDNDSHLMINQIRTVSKQRFVKRLGRLEAQIVPKIQRSFRLYFWN